MLAHFSDDSRAFLLRAVSYCYPLKQILIGQQGSWQIEQVCILVFAPSAKQPLQIKCPGLNCKKLKIINSFASEMEVTCRYFTRNFIFIYEPSVDTGWK